MENFTFYNYSTFKLVTYIAFVSTIFVVYSFPELFSNELLVNTMDKFYDSKNIKYNQGKVKSLKIDFCNELCNNESTFKLSCLRECNSRSKIKIILILINRGH